MKAVRAQLELSEQDCARLSAPDYTSGFASLEDAVDRLLPFHVSASMPAGDRCVVERAGLAAPVAVWLPPPLLLLLPMPWCCCCRCRCCPCFAAPCGLHVPHPLRPAYPSS